MNLPPTLRVWGFPLFLFFASLFLRLSLISKGPYHLDCLALAINAQNTLENHQLYYQFGSGYPLTVLMGSFFFAATQWFAGNDPVFAVNFMSVILSSLSVSIFYLFIKNTLNASSAFFSALFLSLHPIFLTLSVYGNSHVVCIFFLLLSLYVLTNPHQKFRYFFFSLFLGLMGASRLQDMILMIIPLSLFSIIWDKNTFSKCQQKFVLLGICLLGSGIVAGAFHIPFLVGKTSSLYSSQFQTFWNIGLTENFCGLFSTFLLRSIQIISFSTTLPGILICWVGLTKIFKENPPIAFLALLWFWIPLFFYGNIITSVPRFFLISIVPLCFAFGYGIDSLLCTKKQTVKLALAFACGVVLLLCNITNIFPILYFRHTNALLPSWAKYINTNTNPQAVIITGDDEMFIKHYGKRQILSRPRSMHRLDKEELNIFNRALQDKLSSGADIYITGMGLFSYDADNVFSSFIKNHYRLEYYASGKYEDWHSGELFLEDITEPLYRIYKK